MRKYKKSTHHECKTVLAKSFPTKAGNYCIELIAVVRQYFLSVPESSTPNTSDANRGYSWKPRSRRRRKLKL
jgi:hypothetical protein